MNEPTNNKDLVVRNMSNKLSSKIMITVYIVWLKMLEHSQKGTNYKIGKLKDFQKMKGSIEDLPASSGWFIMDKWIVYNEKATTTNG